MVGEDRSLLTKVGVMTPLLSVQATEDHISELGTGICHRKRSRAGAILRLDDFVTTKLDAVHKLAIGFHQRWTCHMHSERVICTNRCARMDTDDRDYGFLGVIAADFTKEARGMDDIEGGDIEQTTWSKTIAFQVCTHQHSKVPEN